MHLQLAELEFGVFVAAAGAPSTCFFLGLTNQSNGSIFGHVRAFSGWMLPAIVYVVLSGSSRIAYRDEQDDEGACVA